LHPIWIMSEDYLNRVTDSSASEICPNDNWKVNVLSLTYDNVVLHVQQQQSDILTFNFGNVDP
jgi:hypothetical protein